MPKSAPKFPWEDLKAETLRAMCRDLVVPLSVGRKREDMINALAAIEELGLSKFHAQHQEPPEEEEEDEKPDVKAPARTAAGRKAVTKVAVTAAPKKKPVTKAAKKPAAARKSTRRSSGRSTFDGVVLRSSGPVSSRRRSTKSSTSRA